MLSSQVMHGYAWLARLWVPLLVSEQGPAAALRWKPLDNLGTKGVLTFEADCQTGGDGASWCS